MPAYSQTLTDQYGNPLVGATVKLYDLDHQTLLATTTSIAGGAFSFTAADGLYTLEITYGGVVKDVFPIEIGDANEAFRGPPGVNGGIGSSQGVSALFGAMNGTAIGTGITRVRTSGYAADGIGGADYIYDAAVNSAYVTAYPRAAFLAADGRGFRLDPSQRIMIEMFGGRGDCVTSGDPMTIVSGTLNDTPLAEAVKYISFQPISPNFKFGPQIHFGVGTYRFGALVDLKRIVSLIGCGAGFTPAAGSPTQLIWPNNVSGICVNSFNTLAGGSDPGGNTTSAAGFMARGIAFIQSSGGTNTSLYGFWPRVQFSLQDCVFEGWCGNAIKNVANTGTDPANMGNTCGWYMSRVMVKNVKGHALYVSGDNCNAGTAIGFQCASANGCGIFEQSTLGNTYIGPEIDGAGLHQRGRVSRLGVDYELISHTPGVGESTTPGTNENVWYAVGTSGTFPAWSASPTQPYSVGLPVYDAGGSNTYVGSYFEGHVGHLGTGSIAVGGSCGFTRFSNHQKHSPGTSMLNNRGWGCSLGASSATLPPGHVFGAYISHETDPDLAGGVLERLSYGANGGYVAELKLAGNLVEQRIDASGEVAFGYTLRGNTRTFGRSVAPDEGIFFANNFALGNSNDPGDYRIQQYGTAAPTTGEHAPGEIVWNSSAGGTVDYWRCTVGGTPGTWVARP